MYTFRFNPVFQQWTLLGEQIPQTLIIQDGHKIVPTLKEAPDFQAATYPRQPFVLDAKSVKKHEDDLVYAPQAPIGEYELLLYTGSKSFFEWGEAEWNQWLVLLAERFRAIHLNPYLHFVSLKLATCSLHTAGEIYQRVGDLIATSHPLAGMSVPISPEIITKLHEKERLFVVHEDAHGILYIPTAPLHAHEIWYLPSDHSEIDTLQVTERTSIARSLSAVTRALGIEFPGAHWQFTLHTPIAGVATKGRWWIQIHEDVRTESPLPIQPLPERFTFLMKQLIAHEAHR